MSRKKPKNYWTKTKLKQWEKSFVKWGQFYELHKLMIVHDYEPYKNDKVNAAIKLTKKHPVSHPELNPCSCQPSRIQ